MQDPNASMMLQQMMMMDPAMMMLFGGMGMGMGNPYGGMPSMLDMQRMMQMESMMGGLGGMDPYMMSMMMQ